MIPEVSRRLFLRRSLQGGAWLATAGLLPAAAGCGPGGDRQPLGRLARLDRAAAHRLDAVADAFVPEGGAFVSGARSVDLVSRIDALLAPERAEVVDGLASALAVLDWGAPLLAGRLGRFTALDLDGRTRCLEALAHSRFAAPRELYAALKQLSLFAFYAVDEVWPAVGYDGPWVGHAVGASPRGGA